MSKAIARYSDESKGEQHVLLNILVLFENKQFELYHELGGTFGSFISRYTGSYYYEEVELVLSVETGYDRRWTIHDEDPIEDSGEYKEIIKVTRNDDESLTFKFPESPETVRVTLFKESS